MKPLAPNTLLQNRYLVVQLIGKGGMGEVYLAVDQRLGSAVALKRTSFSDDEVLAGAFEREARTLARMRHPVLPKVSDHFIENENQFLVMEHIAGEDLSKRLEASQKPFPLSWVLFWADQLLDALAYLHTHEPPILHRDIKPQNLKLTSDNNIILLDFGLSKNSVGETRISSAGSSGFTPHYAPMEQIRGTGTSPRSDIYSLSATLYQLLTNKVPPDSLSRADALLNGSPDPIEPVENLNTEVTKVVSDVILKGISVSQEQRFATAREMQKELRDAYAKMQKAMAAQTIAFNAQSEQIVPDAVSTEGKTEPVAAAPEAQTPLQALIETQAISSIFGKEMSEGDTVPYNTPPPSVLEQDFDKTIAYDLPPEAAPQKQSDVKTEVFSNAFFPSGEPVEEVKPDVDTEPETFEPPVSTSAQTNENILPETMFNAAKTADENDFSAVAAAPVESFSKSADFSQPAVIPAQKQGNYSKELYPLPAVQTQPQPEKKSKGKALAIAGGLVALLFLALTAAGVGWYLYTGGSFSVNSATPTPSPESTIAPTPTPQEIIAETNTDTNTTIETPANTNTQVSNQQEITKTETPGATPKPSVSPSVVKPTPKQTQLSTAGTPKTTPKATPKKNDRIEILQ
jgi:serine/threonine protein kinase